MNMTSKSDCIGVTCTRLRHFADTVSQWNSCWKIKTLGHMAENKCGYQMHIFVTSLSSQYDSSSEMACVACSICAQIIQRILWCYNGFYDFHWNHIQRSMCSSGAIRLSAGDIRYDLTQISHWIGQNPGVRNITYKDLKKNWSVYIREFLCISYYCAF